MFLHGYGFKKAMATTPVAGEIKCTQTLKAGHSARRERAATGRKRLAGGPCGNSRWGVRGLLKVASETASRGAYGHHCSFAIPEIKAEQEQTPASSGMGIRSPRRQPAAAAPAPWLRPPEGVTGAKIAHKASGQLHGLNKPLGALGSPPLAVCDEGEVLESSSWSHALLGSARAAEVLGSPHPGCL